MINRKRLIGWSLGILVNTLLNLIDAIAVGQLFFPPADPFFVQFSLDGIGLYLAATSMAQLVLPLMTKFRGAVAAGMMAECLPFINMIVNRIGSGLLREEEKIPTVLMAFVAHTLTISAAFFILVALRLDKVAQKCPKQVLLGAMGGIGIFLVKTAIDQAIKGPIGSAWRTIGYKQLAIIGAGALPAMMTIWSRRRSPGKSPFLVPISLISLIILFYSIALPLGYSMEQLRHLDWIIDGPKRGTNPLRIYAYFSWDLIDWNSVASCWSIFLSSAAFAMLQLPINVPSFGRSTKQPVSLRSEFLANSVINLVTSVVGMQPSYFMYTPSVLLVQAGADHRYCSYGLGVTTGLALFFGLGIIKYIPIPAVLFLLFYLGFELVLEATVDSRRFSQRKDVLLIGLVMLVMAVFGFVQGLFVGLVISFVMVFWEQQGLPVSAQTFELVYLVEGWQELVRYGPIEDAFLAQIREVEVKCLSLNSFYYFGNLVETAEAIKSHIDPLTTRYIVIDLSKVPGNLGMALLEMIEEVTGDLLMPWTGSIVIVSEDERCKQVDGRDGIVKVVPKLIDAVVWIDRIMMLELDIDLVTLPAYRDEEESDDSPLIQNDFYTKHQNILAVARTNCLQTTTLESQCLDALGPLESITVTSGTILWHPKEHLKALYILTSPSSLVVELSAVDGRQLRRWGGGRAWLGVPQVMRGLETDSTCVVLTDSRVMIVPEETARLHMTSISLLFLV